MCTVYIYITDLNKKNFKLIKRNVYIFNYIFYYLYSNLMTNLCYVSISS